MKRSFWDFFSHEFDVRLSVSSRDTVSGQNIQWRGVSVLSSDGKESFPVSDEGDVEKAMDLLRKLRPSVLRFSADSPNAELWLRFCRQEEIHPHICFSPDADPEKTGALVSRCAAEFAENDLWKPFRFYEVFCDPDDLTAENDEVTAEQIGSIRQMGNLLRTADPDARIILGGIAPIGSKRAAAEIWNCALIRECGEVMDMIGVFLQPSVSSEWVRDDETTVEANYSLAEQIRMGIRRLDRQIRETAPDSEIQIAVTGWGSLPDGTPQKCQDNIFYSSVYRTLRMACSGIPIVEAGPLFGPGGLIRYENGNLFGDVFYHHQMLTSMDLPVCLEAKEPDFEKPIPVYHWEGVPGILEGGEIKMAEVIASRSTDGERLYFLIANRSPFKQCVLRIRFYDIPDLHPIGGWILKSEHRQDSNTSQQPDNVYCKEIRMGNFRRMNHVTIEIPPCSSASMLLE